MRTIKRILLCKPFNKIYLGVRYWKNLGALIEINYLINRHARRCNYDFIHCVNDMSMTLHYADEIAAGKLTKTTGQLLFKEFRERLEMYITVSNHWENVFDPADDGKLYRTKWDHHINDLDREIRKYKKILRDNNLGHLIPMDDAPF